MIDPASGGESRSSRVAFSTNCYKFSDNFNTTDHLIVTRPPGRRRPERDPSNFPQPGSSATVCVNESVKESKMRASDVVPISEARARLTELAEEVVGAGAEKILTKNGASYVAMVDADVGLRQVLEGQAGTEDELKRLLAD